MGRRACAREAVSLCGAVHMRLLALDAHVDPPAPCACVCTSHTLGALPSVGRDKAGVNSTSLQRAVAPHSTSCNGRGPVVTRCQAVRAAGGLQCAVTRKHVADTAAGWLFVLGLSGSRAGAAAGGGCYAAARDAANHTKSCCSCCSSHRLRRPPQLRQRCRHTLLSTQSPAAASSVCPAASQHEPQLAAHTPSEAPHQPPDSIRPARRCQDERVQACRRHDALAVHHRAAAQNNGHQVV